MEQKSFGGNRTLYVSIAISTCVGTIVWSLLWSMWWALMMQNMAGGVWFTTQSNGAFSDYSLSDGRADGSSITSKWIETVWSTTTYDLNNRTTYTTDGDGGTVNTKGTNWDTTSQGDDDWKNSWGEESPEWGLCGSLHTKNTYGWVWSTDKKRFEDKTKSNPSLLCASSLTLVNNSISYDKQLNERSRLCKWAGEDDCSAEHYFCGNGKVEKEGDIETLIWEPEETCDDKTNWWCDNLTCQRYTATCNDMKLTANPNSVAINGWNNTTTISWTIPKGYGERDTTWTPSQPITSKTEVITKQGRNEITITIPHLEKTQPPLTCTINVTWMVNGKCWPINNKNVYIEDKSDPLEAFKKLYWNDLCGSGSAENIMIEKIGLNNNNSSFTRSCKWFEWWTTQSCSTQYLYCGNENIETWTYYNNYKANEECDDTKWWCDLTTCKFYTATCDDVKLTLNPNEWSVPFNTQWTWTIPMWFESTQIDRWYQSQNNWKEILNPTRTYKERRYTHEWNWKVQLTLTQQSNKKTLACTSDVKAKLNGECGAKNGKNYTSIEFSTSSESLCSKWAANPTAPVVKNNERSRSCQWINWWTDAQCKAFEKVDWVCNVAKTNKTFYDQKEFEADSEVLCSKWTANPSKPTLDTTNNQWTWGCKWIHGWGDVSCFSKQKINWVCGSSMNGKNYYNLTINSTSISDKTAWLCDKGAVNGFGRDSSKKTWNWTCWWVNWWSSATDCKINHLYCQDSSKQDSTTQNLIAWSQSPVEQCDDSNDKDGDGCNRSCQAEEPNCTQFTVSPTNEYVDMEITARWSFHTNGFHVDTLDRWNNPIISNPTNPSKNKYTEPKDYTIKLTVTNKYLNTKKAICEQRVQIKRDGICGEHNNKTIYLLDKESDFIKNDTPWLCKYTTPINVSFVNDKWTWTCPGENWWAESSQCKITHLYCSDNINIPQYPPVDTIWTSTQPNEQCDEWTNNKDWWDNLCNIKCKFNPAINGSCGDTANLYDFDDSGDTWTINGNASSMCKEWNANLNTLPYIDFTPWHINNWIGKLNNWKWTCKGTQKTNIKWSDVTCEKKEEYCGDGTVNGGEECDDWDKDDYNACSNTCEKNTYYRTCELECGEKWKLKFKITAYPLWESYSFGDCFLYYPSPLFNKTYRLPYFSNGNRSTTYELPWTVGYQLRCNWFYHVDKKWEKHFVPWCESTTKTIIKWNPKTCK